MTEQLHRRFVDEQVKELLERYERKEIELKYVLEFLGIKRRRFFKLLQEYRKDPEGFSIAYNRKKRTRKIKKEIEGNILSELNMKKKLIENKEMP